MNKKQRNRKIVCQNNRNRMMNRRYTSTIKTLTKLFHHKIKTILETNPQEKNMKMMEVTKVVNNLYSIIDKAVKKGIVHKNTAARKKSTIGVLFVKTRKISM